VDFAPTCGPRGARETRSPHKATDEKMFRLLAIALLATAAECYKLPAGSMGRRSAIAGAATTCAIFLNPAASEASVKACAKGANNCYSASSSGKNQMPIWTFPAGAEKDSALKTLAEVVNSYPQAGQNDADKGGWTLVDGDLASGNAKLEFRSGLGNFAKFFNGGKPFVDDLEFSLADGGVSVFSSSRVGDSDFGVNMKRLNWISAKLRAQGWNAPDVKPLQ
jgi:uncharacterized protein (DUF1499 family)